MTSFEKVVARICLEHGWASRAQVSEAVRARSQEPEHAAASLSSLLVVRGVLTKEQAQILQTEAAEVTRSGTYADVRLDDTWLGQLLVDAGTVTAAQVEEALAHQKDCAARKVPLPRLGEILIEKGHLTFAALQEALQRQSRLVHLSCPACGTRYVVEQLESGKTSLCQKCASPLAVATRGAAIQPSEPEEVTQAASDPVNVLGKYVLVRQIGRGAMGGVYKGWDRSLRRWVALKVLLATSDPQLVLRFRREAETAAALQHPHIVPIYDVGESGARPFIVMKMIEGSTLAGMSLDLQQACAVMLQAARGVGYAHEHDVIHRDLKPGNIMVDEAGHVYVLDFGLAKELYGAAGMTAPGTLMGTPSYMSPEQAAGKIQHVDRSSDVYALGAILYELVTGKAPFRGSRTVETLRQVIEDPVTPPSRIRSDVPPELEKLILKTLEKEKSRRPATASDFARTLESITAKPAPAVPSLQPGAPAPTPPADSAVRQGAPKALFWAMVLLVLSVLAGLGVLSLFRGGDRG